MLSNREIFSLEIRRVRKKGVLGLNLTEDGFIESISSRVRNI